MTALQLIEERKIHDLFADRPPRGALEASGVLAMNGKFFVVFDNRTSVARLAEDLSSSPMNGLFGMAHGREGFEGIAYNPFRRRFYLLIESRKTRKGKYKPEIFEYSDSLEHVRDRKVDFVFQSENKGFEAVACIRRAERDYLLGLCEGNACKSGRKGRKRGKGRIQLFTRKKQRWVWIGTIKLPRSVRFRDYSAMAIAGNRIAVASQEDSLLWIGEFDERGWRWCGDGEIYAFPRSAAGEIQYGNIEGVSWLSERRIVAVSDRRKSDQPVLTAAKDQSIHIFEIPRAALTRQ